MIIWNTSPSRKRRHFCNDSRRTRASFSTEYHFCSECDRVLEKKATGRPAWLRDAEREWSQASDSTTNGISHLIVVNTAFSIKLFNTWNESALLAWSGNSLQVTNGWTISDFFLNLLRILWKETFRVTATDVNTFTKVVKNKSMLRLVGLHF